MRPVNPVPIAIAARPGASCSSVAIALACTSGCRRFGNEHRRAQPDALGCGRREREHHPDVAVQRGRVVQPGPPVAEAPRPPGCARRCRATAGTRRRSPPRGYYESARPGFWRQNSRHMRGSCRQNLLVLAGPGAEQRARSGRRARPARRASRPRPASRPAPPRPGRHARTVDSRCAITMTVRPSMSRSSACSTSSSVPGSSDDVASSSTTTAGSASAARTSEMSWRSPAEKFAPRSCTSVSSPSANAANRASSSSASIAAWISVVGRVGLCDEEVVADRAAEQEALLRHDDDALPQ